MDKLILVHYINVGFLNKNESYNFFNKIQKSIMEQLPKGVICYWFTIKNGESKVECINPKLISLDEFKEVKNILDKNQKIVDDIIKNEN